MVLVLTKYPMLWATYTLVQAQSRKVYRADDSTRDMITMINDIHNFTIIREE